jgi:hypothetical protein
MEQRIELLWELIQSEPLVRWSVLAGIGLVWLACAWLSPAPLLAAMMLAGTVYVVRRRRGDHLAPRRPHDDDLDLF